MNNKLVKSTELNSNELVGKATPVNRPEGFLPVEEFARIKAIEEKKVIGFVRRTCDK